MEFDKKNVNVVRRSKEPFYGISMYLYNKNTLEYPNIVITESNPRIRYTEDHSTTFQTFGTLTPPNKISVGGREKTISNGVR